MAMQFEWTGEIIEWRGPAPFQFVALPDEFAEAIGEQSGELTYGWGCIPVTATIGTTTYTTSMFPRDGGYLLPVKVAVRRAERIDLGDTVTIELLV